MKEIEDAVTLPNREIVYGALSAITGDNQAIHMIYGFKESFAAEHPCRYCSVLSEEVKIMINENNQRLRWPTAHDVQVT